MTAPELKPCPFCGGTDTFILNGPVEDDWSAVACDKCSARGPTNYTDPHAIAAWNRRADLAAVQPAQVRVKAGEIERAVWLAMAWAVRNAKQLQGDILPAYTDSGNSDAETACRIASTRIIAALEPQPDPRDEVIARLVEAASVTLHDIDDLVANSSGVAGLHMNGDIADWETILDGGTFGAWLSSVENLRAALAAAKAVQHG